MTYFPDTEFIERLNRIRSQVSRVIVIDNTDEGRSTAPLLDIQESADLEIIRNNDNLGVGAALNQGLTRAKELLYPWVIMFDQDTWVTPDLVNTLSEIYKLQSDPELVAIIGCSFEDKNLGLSAHENSVDGPLFMETQTVITSGSLISTDIFALAGPFRSDFFIDFVDHEYCLRLRRLGYKIVVSAKPLMIHALGHATKFRFATGIGVFSIVLTNRSPLRRYFMTRNGLLVARNYFTAAPKWVIRSSLSLLLFAILKIPFEGTDRWNKFRATLYGVLDAIRSRTYKPQAKWLRN